MFWGSANPPYSIARAVPLVSAGWFPLTADAASVFNIPVSRAATADRNRLEKPPPENAAFCGEPGFVLLSSPNYVLPAICPAFAPLCSAALPAEVADLGCFRMVDGL